MFDFLSHLFDTSGFPPRWYCGRWTPGNGWLHIGSDIGIWAAYVSIPLVLGYFLLRRRNLRFRGVLVLFGSFILACGTTHLMDAIIFWWPAYRLAGVIKLFTALISWATVLVLIRVTPVALAMRTPEELEREIEERQRSERALRYAHAETEHLLASISSILISVDANCRITKWNAAAESTFGISAAAVLGKPLSECKIGWNDTGLPAQIAQLQHIEAPHRLDDIRYQDSDGRERLLVLTVSPIRREDGSAGLLLLGNDVTEQRCLESQLRHAQKLESIGQLAAGIAHEINTPIQYVSDNNRFLEDGFADLGNLLLAYDKLLLAAKSHTLSDELLERTEEARWMADLDYLALEIPRAIEQSLDGLDRVATIVRAMKEFSHPGADEKTPTDLNRCIESTLVVARNEWRYAADLHTDLDPSLPLVPCRPNDFNQVILNLVVNAVHAIADAPQQGPDGKGSITVSTRHTGDWVEVRVADTGTGIPEAVRPRIFDPFFTTKDVGQGTGQGLAIAYSVIVEKHGGSISFETEVGRGTTFIVRLPLAVDASVGDEAAAVTLTDQDALATAVGGNK